MRLTTAVLMLVLMLLPFSVTSVPTNVHTPPPCIADVNKLPIFQLKARKDKLSRYYSSSTIFLIGRNRWATSSHSVGYGKHKVIEIQLPNGDSMPGKVIYNDRSGDIAIIEADSGKMKPLKLHQTFVYKFQQTFNIGFPGIDRGVMHSYHGMVLRYNKRGFIINSALGLKGMSGGASVVCHKGNLEVVGVISAHDTSVISETFYTDGDGIIHQIRTALNAGTTWVSPIDLILLKESGAPVLEWILNE